MQALSLDLQLQRRGYPAARRLSSVQKGSLANLADASLIDADESTVQSPLPRLRDRD